MYNMYLKNQGNKELKMININMFTAYVTKRYIGNSGSFSY